MQLKRSLARFHQNHQKLFNWLHYILITVSVAAFVAWILKIDVKYIDSEAAFSGVMIAFTAFNQSYRWLIEEAEFSPAYALAFGYVENFLEPVITQLIGEGKSPIFCIYRPQKFDEIFDKNIERVKGKLKNSDYSVGEINLNLKYGRSRDIMIIEKGEGKQTYFDFPGTLKSLIPYVEYKIDSKKNSSDEKKKEELGQELIDKFFEKVQELSEKKGLSPYINSCGSDLDIGL